MNVYNLMQIDFDYITADFLNSSSRFEEEQKDLSKWLERNHYVKISESSTKNLYTLTQVLFPENSVQVVSSVKGFIQNFLKSGIYFKRLYSEVFVNYLNENVQELSDLSERPNSSKILVYLTILSHIMKVRVKLIYYSPEFPNSVKLGTTDWPSRVTVVKHGDLLWAVKRSENICSLSSSSQRPRRGTEEMVFSRKKKESSNESEEEDVINFSQSQIHRNSFSTRSDFSILDAIENTRSESREQVQEKPSLPNFRFLPYPAGSRMFDISDRRSSRSHYRPAPVTVSMMDATFASETSGSRSQNHSNMQSFSRSSNLINHKFQDKVIHEDESFRKGFVKFFSPTKEYGFILSGTEEFFLHKDDLIKAGVELQTLQNRLSVQHKNVEFRVLKYQGKSRISAKAIDIKFL